MLPEIVHAEALRTPLALVVAGTDAEGVHVAIVFLALRMDVRVAIHFAGGCLQQRTIVHPRQVQQMHGPDHGRLDGVERIFLVMYRRCGTGQIDDG